MEKYFKLKEGEEVIISANDVLVFANENKITANIIVTTKRIVLLQDVNRQLIAVDYFHNRGDSFCPEYEVVYELKLTDISKFKYLENNNSFFLKNGNILKIYCEDITGFLKDLK